MRKSLAILVCGVMLFVGVMAFLAPADARRAGGARGHGHHHHAAHRGHRHAAHRHAHRGYAARHNINRNVNVNRNVNANRRYAYRNGVRGYWRNGRWIAAPIAVGAGAGVAGYVATCAYEYNQWQATGSAYWRSRYNQCAGI